MYACVTLEKEVLMAKDGQNILVIFKTDDVGRFLVF